MSSKFKDWNLHPRMVVIRKEKDPKRARRPYVSIVPEFKWMREPCVIKRRIRDRHTGRKYVVLQGIYTGKIKTRPFSVGRIDVCFTRRGGRGYEAISMTRDRYEQLIMERYAQSG